MQVRQLTLFGDAGPRKRRPKPAPPAQPQEGENWLLALQGRAWDLHPATVIVGPDKHTGYYLVAVEAWGKLQPLQQPAANLVRRLDTTERYDLRYYEQEHMTRREIDQYLWMLRRACYDGLPSDPGDYDRYRTQQRKEAPHAPQRRTLEPTRPARPIRRP